jgi:hypothetical protein
MKVVMLTDSSLHLLAISSPVYQNVYRASVTRRLVLQSTLLVETPHQREGRLTTPSVEDELLKLVDVDRGKPNQDGREAGIVWLCEELARARSEQDFLLGEVVYPDGDDVQIGYSRLLWMNPFHPDPDDTFALAVIVHGKRDAITV